MCTWEKEVDKRGCRVWVDAMEDAGVVVVVVRMHEWEAG